MSTRSALAALLCLATTACAQRSPAPEEALPPRTLAFAHWSGEQRLVAYRQLEKLWPSHEVKAGGAPLPLPASATPIDPRAVFEGEDYTVDSFMRANNVSGLIALKNGEIVLERYAFGRKPEDRWVSFSVTKSITSTLIGAAIKDGHIRSVRDPVTRYVPELKGSAYDKVTIQHLLTMTSGSAWNEDYSDPEADVYAVTRQPAFGALNPTVRYMKALPPEAPPGRRFLYNTGDTDLAGIVLSAAVGKPVHQYLSEKIWAPLGMERDGSWPMDMGGQVRGGCCLGMTLRDYARFGLFMLNGGTAGGRSLLPEDWIAEATRAHNAEPGYGYFWWVGEHAYVARGIHGQAIYVVPDRQLVVAVNSAWPEAWNATDFARQEAFVQAIGEAARAGGPSRSSDGQGTPAEL